MAQRFERPEETLGLRLLLARTRMRLSLKQVEAATGISQSMLSDYENDVREPTTKRLRTLAGLYGSTPNDLLGFDGATGRFRRFAA